jgi:hypothetical protein
MQALMLLDDGASYTEVARTLGCDRKWVSKRFPGRGWTAQEGGAYGFMVRKANERMRLQ